MTNLENICAEVEKIAKKAGVFIADEREKITGNEIQSKGDNNFVTYVDKTAEKMIVDDLQELIPEAGFIVEEGTSEKKGDVYRWIVDPLDGTTNFLHSVPPFCISIALQENEETILGLVYEICMNECFYSWKGGKAYLNGKEIRVSEAKKIKNSLISTGFPYSDFSLIKEFMQSLEYFFAFSHGVRRHGSAAADLAYVAAGRFETFYEYSLKPWDVAAGAFIIQQAGGKISDFDGQKNYIFGQQIVATNGYVHDEFLHHVNRFLIKKEKIDQ
jgi:myo-inositol-1(or 4)-monophosphatase